MPKIIKIGSRGSDLALWQANFTKKQLEDLGCEVEIIIIKTKGDTIQHLSFDKIEGKGFFTKELEEALLAGKIDLAVHSHKDLPTECPKGLVIAGVSYREDCSETILIRKEAYQKFNPLSLKQNAVVGTSSLRRKSQISHIRPDINTIDLRGNVPTRIEKLRNGEYDAIMLATAGLNRLNPDLSEFHTEKLPPYLFIPAPAQGVLAFQTRKNDADLITTIAKINKNDVSENIHQERWILNQMDGGCQLPLGVYCEKKENAFHLWASLLPLDNKPFRRIYLKEGSKEQIALNALNALTRIENRKVYISRDQQDTILFYDQVTDYGYDLIAEAPLSFEMVEVNHFPFADWIFFTSKRAVEFFFQQNMIPSQTARIGALGSGTASSLMQLGIHPHFSGNDGDTIQTAHEFSKIAKGLHVMFPVSENGMRTVQKILEPVSFIHELVVYRSIQKKINTNPSAEISVFTSPSAFRAFTNQFGIPTGELVAMGKSTQQAMVDA